MAKVRERADVAVLGEIARIDLRLRGSIERLLPDGLSASQFAVLGHLAAAGEDRSPGALAKAFGLTKGAITNTLRRLQVRGLIAIATDEEDARRRWVRLTPAGSDANRACLAAARPAREALRQALPTEAFEAALPFLKRLRTFLEERG
ncbi:MAG TPA: MarR family transcriptional regulator [Caulobacteraceae bacterium]|nr:MarR family transcriptional regulator [Caulobacteraceae bacterium]